MSLTTADLPGQLLTLEQLHQRIEPTDSLVQVPFDAHPVKVHLPSGWNLGLKEAHGEKVTDAVVSVNGQDTVLTKDAALELTTAFGLTKDYVSKTPGALIADQVNWWLGNSDKEMKMLRAPNGVGLAFTKAAVTPFSNIRLVESALAALAAKYGDSVIDEVRVDYKLQHDLRRTSIRLILPAETGIVVDSARHTAADPDVWSLGLHLFNSLIGEKPLSLSGYLFAWVCTNGAISTHATSGNYSRRTSGQGEEVYEWSRLASDEILVALDPELSQVRDLPDVDLSLELDQVMKDIFTQYKVPLTARESIVAALMYGEDPSMYGVMQAVTAAANQQGLADSVVTTLMEIGGDIPTATSGRCNHCHRLQVAS